MLNWLNRNIAAFGGDPSRVFLFGTSAGGGNICALMTSPMTKGLFHGAAMQSSVPAACELQTLAEVERGTGARVVKAAGCDQAGDVAGCLRTKSVEEIVSAVPGTFGIFPRIYGRMSTGTFSRTSRSSSSRRSGIMPCRRSSEARPTRRLSS